MLVQLPLCELCEDHGGLQSDGDKDVLRDALLLNSGELIEELCDRGILLQHLVADLQLLQLVLIQLNRRLNLLYLVLYGTLKPSMKSLLVQTQSYHTCC